MLRMIMAAARHRPGRAVAQIAGIAFATTSFALLTATANASTLNVVSSVEAANRPVYDILVRPRGTQLPTERERGLVQPGYLSGIYGGISLEQWRTIAGLPDVGVAAPVAMLGYGTPSLPTTIELAEHASGRAGRQVLRVELTWRSDRGLTSVAGVPTQYVYTTDRPLTGSEYELTEQLADGASRPVCRGDVARPGMPDTLLRCWSPAQEGSPPAPDAAFGWTMPYLIAAVDPAAEAQLAGLDQAIVAGRYLAAEDVVGEHTGPLPGGRGGDVTWTRLPVLIAAKPQIDRELDYRIVRLDPSAAELIAAGGTADQLAGITGEVVATGRIDSAGAYERFLDRFGNTENVFDRLLPEFFSTGPVTYAPAGQGLAPQPQAIDRAAVWGGSTERGAEGWADMPEEAADPAYRSIVPHRAMADEGSARRSALLLSAVGRFDVTRLPAWSELSAVPMETYFATGAAAGDDATRAALRGGDLAPNANFGGFLGQAPSILTTLDALPSFLDGNRFTNIDPAWSAAPLSVVRVRLAGELGLDELSRERVRLVAEQIATRTGLEVDIMVGSSPTQVPIALAEGAHGRPALALTQPWAKKGVAVSIVDAVDRKSLLLFVLILAVCTLFVTNATAASVRSRRLELAVLACLGWRASALYRSVMVEAAGYGLLASLLGAAATLPAGRVLGLHPDPRWLLVTVPVTTALAVLAALGPARQAARTDPAAAIRPPVVVPRRSRPPRTIAALALANVTRQPGRTLIGAASLAIGVSALTLLAAITVAFQGAVVGTLLGDAVSVQARAGDYLAAVLTVLIGVAVVADVVYLNVRERGAEFATLRACGWRERELARVVIYETLLIGIVGALLGVLLAAGLLTAFLGALPAALWPVMAAVVVGGVLLTTLSAALPLAAVRRLPTAALLGE